MCRWILGIWALVAASSAVMGAPESIAQASSFIPSQNGMRHFSSYQEGVAFYKGLLERDSRSVEAHTGLGYMYDRLGETNIAIRYYFEALKLAPRDHEIYRLLGDLYAGKGMQMIAFAYYRKAVTLAPDDYLAYCGFANYYYARGKYPSAVEYYQKVLGLSPAYADAHVGLGLSYLRLKEYRLAREELLRGRTIFRDKGGYDTYVALIDGYVRQAEEGYNAGAGK